MARLGIWSGWRREKHSTLKLRSTLNKQSPNLRRNRSIIILIGLICIVPFIGAWYLAKHPEWVLNRDKTNYGHLVNPARSLDYAELLQGPVSSAEQLTEIKGRWTLVQITSGNSCSDICRETAHKSGQLRLMLNKELTRVRRILLVHNPADTDSLPALIQGDPTLLVAGLSGPLRQHLQDAVGKPLQEGMLLLLDPFANLMMWYEPGFDPYGVLRDLQRLLKVSQIG